jgi:hypothetical protein
VAGCPTARGAVGLGVFALDAPPLHLVPTVGAWELLQAGYTPSPPDGWWSTRPT